MTHEPDLDREALLRELAAARAAYAALPAHKKIALEFARLVEVALGYIREGKR